MCIYKALINYYKFQNQTQYGEKPRVKQTDYLSPALALSCVELQAQQSSSDHAEPVDVHHVLCILALVAKNAGTYKNRKKERQCLTSKSYTANGHRSHGPVPES